MIFSKIRKKNFLTEVSTKGKTINRVGMKRNHLDIIKAIILYEKLQQYTLVKSRKLLLPNQEHVRMTAVATSIQHSTNSSAPNSKARKEIQSSQIGSKEVKCSLFTDTL